MITIKRIYPENFKKEKIFTTPTSANDFPISIPQEEIKEFIKQEIRKISKKVKEIITKHIPDFKYVKIYNEELKKGRRVNFYIIKTVFIHSVFENTKDDIIEDLKNHFKGYENISLNLNLINNYNGLNKHYNLIVKLKF